MANPTRCQLEVRDAFRSDWNGREVQGHSRARLPVIATVALVALAVSAGVASADVGRDHRNSENTFTKWLTVPGPPLLANMAGVVGGDVGDGTFAGDVVSKTLTATSAAIDAVYQFHGSRHSFTAPVHVVQTGLTVPVISGQVTDGWLNRRPVEGQYTQGTCAHDGVTTTCFQGTLDILRGSKSEG